MITAVKHPVDTVLEVLRTIRRFTSESYYEGDALVTHGLIEIDDVKIARQWRARFSGKVA